MIEETELPSPKTFLVKFFFTNAEHIPPAIPERGRSPNAEMDAYHAAVTKAAGMGEQGELGRIRDGRVDTGTHVAELHDVQAAMLRTGFASNGWLLAGAHWHRQEPRGPRRNGKCVVTLSFTRVEDASAIPEIPRRAIDVLRDLAKTTWQHCHVWANPNGVVTVNLVGKRLGWSPRLILAIRNGRLKAIPIRNHL